MDDTVEQIVDDIARLDDEQLALLLDRLSVLEQQVTDKVRAGLN